MAMALSNFNRQHHPSVSNQSAAGTGMAVPSLQGSLFAFDALLYALQADSSGLQQWHED
jgi:hypothetical protein